MRQHRPGEASAFSGRRRRSPAPPGGSRRLPVARGSGRRGSRTPKASPPTRFRDGVPRRWQSFRSGPGRRRTCNPPSKNRELCRVELRSRDVTGRSRTCNAPGFNRALFRVELRSRWCALGREAADFRGVRASGSASADPEACDGKQWARLGSNQRPPACKTGALPVELLARAPGQGFEPRSPRSERGVLPVRRSRNEAARAPLRPALLSSTQRRRGVLPAMSRSATLRPNVVFHATRLPFDPGSPSARARLAAGGVLRGGALEPEPRHDPDNSQAKADTLLQRDLCRRAREGLSLSGGASIRS